MPYFQCLWISHFSRLGEPVASVRVAGGRVLSPVETRDAASSVESTLMTWFSTQALSSSSDMALLVHGHSCSFRYAGARQFFIAWLGSESSAFILVLPSLGPFKTLFNWQTHNLIVITRVLVCFH